jgi:DNA polymerase-4
MPLRNLFLDFNAYFASVEQQIKPELRNKPVGVVPVMAETTCCIAASYEAKSYGVKTGTLVSEAKKLCPDIKFVEASHRTYVEFHNRLKKAIEYCLPVDRVLSIDEMVCSLMGKERKRENAIEIAHRIKKKISSDVGEYLKCSIGIAPNQYLAKTATDLQKPDGLVVIEEEDLPQCLYKLEIDGLCGIGRRMKVRLRRSGIYTIEQLCSADKLTLQKVWGGIEGERMYDQLRGKIVQRPTTHRSTVGHSHVLPPKLRNNESAYAVLHRLLQKATMRMRYIGYYASALGVIVRYSKPKAVVSANREESYNYEVPPREEIGLQLPKKFKWKDYITFNYTQNTVELIKGFNKMWGRNPYKEFIPTQVGVVLFNLLDEKYATLPIFEDYEKNKSLYKAIDLLNRRYGYSAVYFGGAHTARNSAPMRIAFTQIPNLEIEDDQKSV